MDVAFGRSFSQVRVHRGPSVDGVADALGASAFTVGCDVYLHARAPGLDTIPGRAVLGEELAHVAQGAGSGESPQRVTSPGEAIEQQAKSAGQDAAVGQRVAVDASPQAPLAIARQESIPALADPNLSQRRIRFWLGDVRMLRRDVLAAAAFLKGKPPLLDDAFMALINASLTSQIVMLGAPPADKVVAKAIRRHIKLAAEHIRALREPKKALEFHLDNLEGYILDRLTHFLVKFAPIHTEPRVLAQAPPSPPATETASGGGLTA